MPPRKRFVHRLVRHHEKGESDSEDDGARRNRRPRLEPNVGPLLSSPRKDPLESYTDEKAFQRHHRFTKEGFGEVLKIFEQAIKDSRKGPQGKFPLTPAMELSVALQFLSSGSFQRVAGRTQGLSISHSGKVIRRVLKIIAESSPAFITMPDMSELRRSAFELQRRFGIPQVAIGVDGTHIWIQKPSANDPALPDGVIPKNFYNRKGWVSLNIQMVGDGFGYIRDLDPRWPGSGKPIRMFFLP